MVRRSSREYSRGVEDTDVLIEGDDGRRHRVPYGIVTRANLEVEFYEMSNPLQQTIEALAKEKGIEPDVVISAIEEAVATASRKFYKTGENLKTRFNMETGQVDLFALKQVVQEVTNPAIEIGIDEARQMYRQVYGDEVANSIELGDEMEFPKPTEVLGRNCGPDRQAGDLSESPRGGAGEYFRGIQPAHR